MKASELLSLSDISSLRQQAEQLQSTAGSSQKLDSRNAGWLPTSALGSGMDYAESRPYQQGDDPRSINWRLSARSTETYVKSYHMESRPNVCIVLDQRRSMIFGTRSRLKTTQALRAALLISFIAQQHQLKVHYLLINNKCQWLDDLKFEEFLKISNQVSLTDSINKEVSFSDCLYQLTNFNRLKSGSLVYMISDFLDIEAKSKPLLAQLGQLNEHCFVQALHIIDPAEQQLPACTKGQERGEVYLQHMLSDTNITIDFDTRDNLQATMDKHINQIQQVLMTSAINYTKIITHEDTIHPHICLPLGH